MLLEKPLLFAHRILSDHISAGDVAIDATSGRGRDTAVLAELVGPTGRVYAFDIQQEAIDSTRQLLAEKNLDERVNLVLADHASMRGRIAPEDLGRVKGICFNLGYLPSGDRDIITNAESTVLALQEAIDLVRPGGVITIVIYTGHPGGVKEDEAILNVVRSLGQASFTVYEMNVINQINSPAKFVAIQKIE